MEHFENIVRYTLSELKNMCKPKQGGNLVMEQ